MPNAIWDELLDAGQEFGIKPCGLGARNTLRLEAKMALYGHEIDAIDHAARSRPRLDRQVRQRRFRRHAPRCEKQKADGVKRKLVGFEMRGRGIGRDGYEVLRRRRSRPAGSPAADRRRRLNKNIGLVLFCRSKRRRPGRTIQIMIRNQPVDAVTVPTPFYKRAK